jgi:hypothetical protein
MEKQSEIIVAWFALHNLAMDYNKSKMDVDGMIGHGAYCHRTDQQNDQTRNWLAASVIGLQPDFMVWHDLYAVEKYVLLRM